MVLCFSIYCFSCGPSSKHVATFIYILDECQLRWQPFCEALLPTTSPTKQMHTYTHKTRPLPLFSHCDFLHHHLFVHLFQENLSDSRGLILVSPGHDTQQVFNGWREFSYGNLISLQRSCLNQISFALNLATYKSQHTSQLFFLGHNKTVFNSQPKSKLYSEISYRHRKS